MIPRISLCPAVVCMLLLGALFAPDTALGKTNLVPVSGRVVDGDTGKPVSGALVGVYESGRKAVRADARGAFKVLGMPGEKRLLYYDGGNPLYRSDPSTYTVEDVPAKGVSGVVLTLWKKQFGHGKVFTPSGMPLAGASVTIGGATFSHAVTDSNGKFKIEASKEQSKPGG